MIFAFPSTVVHSLIPDFRWSEQRRLFAGSLGQKVVYNLLAYFRVVHEIRLVEIFHDSSGLSVLGLADKETALRDNRWGRSAVYLVVSDELLHFLPLLSSLDFCPRHYVAQALLFYLDWFQVRHATWHSGICVKAEA